MINNISKKHTYLIRVWEFPDCEKIEDQFMFQSNFNPEIVSEEADFWYDLFKHHPVCTDRCTNWEFVYFMEWEELVA